MGALFIDDDTRGKITAVIAHAEKNIFSMDDLLDLLNKQALPAGDRKGFSCIIPVGYRCVYSLEMQAPDYIRSYNV